MSHPQCAVSLSCPGYSCKISHPKYARGRECAMPVKIMYGLTENTLTASSSSLSCVGICWTGLESSNRAMACARSSLQLWACHLPFQVAVYAMWITLLSARPCWPETCLCGGAFTFRHVVLPLRVPSFAPICGGLRGRTGPARSPITSCPSQ